VRGKCYPICIAANIHRSAATSSDRSWLEKTRLEVEPMCSFVHHCTSTYITLTPSTLARVAGACCAWWACTHMYARPPTQRSAIILILYMYVVSFPSPPPPLSSTTQPLKKNPATFYAPASSTLFLRSWYLRPRISRGWQIWVPLSGCPRGEKLREIE
jgi:hypothetical protein